MIKGRYIAGVGAEYADAPALQRIDARGATAVPGFIDAHLHIESSMMTPVTFETATLPRGLTTVICDPHEIVNVMEKPDSPGLPAVPNRQGKTSTYRSALAYPP
ncbi:amidohydrolase family protein [Escherichia coli]